MTRAEQTNDTIRSIATTLVLGTVIGGLASLASIIFIDLVFQLNDLFKVSAQSRALTSNALVLGVATLTVPALGGLVVGFLIWKFSKEKRPLSIADIIADSLSHRHDSSFKNRMVNIIASLISLGCGASVGQYGPIAYLGASIGRILSKLSGKSFYHDNIALCCGVAAAISTVFNAPITGVIFAHEVILRHYSLRAFAPVTVASTVGFVIANQFFDKLPLFSIGIVDPANAGEFIFFALIGITGALIAHLFMTSILYFNHLSKLSRLHPVIKPMIAGLTVGLTALWLPDVMGVGKEAVRLATIEGAFSVLELILLLTAKILLTGICLGFGFAGGVFSPAVFTGIMYGTLWGIVVFQLPGFDHSALVFYTICGMVSVTSPVIGAPLTTIIVVLELTRNYSITTAAMVSVVLANLVAFNLFGRSLFDKVLKRSGIDLSHGRDKAVLNIESITPYILSDYCRLSTDMHLAQIRGKLISCAETEGYFVDENDKFLGSIKLLTLDQMIENETNMNQVGIDYMDKQTQTFTVKTSIWDAMNQIEDFIGESIPVIDDQANRKMIGIVHESSVIKAYLNAVSILRREENI